MEGALRKGERRAHIWAVWELDSHERSGDWMCTSERIGIRQRGVRVRGMVRLYALVSSWG